jgi:hypothetical protein
MEIKIMPVTIPEKRINNLCRRSEYSILAKVFMNGVLEWEENSRELPYKAIRTCTYRLPYPVLVRAIDDTLKNSLYTAIGSTCDKDQPEEAALQDALETYFSAKIAKRTFPLVVAGGEDDVSNDK